VPASPVFVSGDEVRLTQVLCNLLINAAKFTPPHERIALRISQDGQEVEVAVEDGGAGIEPALLPRVFELFVQGAQSMDRRVGGLGLGLAIVKTLVHMHDGRVTAHSEGAGRGSTFTVRLPLDKAPEAPTQVEDEAAAKPAVGSRILIVDDNVDAAMTLAEIVGWMGYEVRAAHDAPGALKSLDSFTPQLAILDIGLPGMNGYELATQLRTLAGLHDLKLIALTGYGEAHDRQRALAARFDEHLVKPVTAERLLEIVARLLGGGAGADGGATQATRH